MARATRDNSTNRARGGGVLMFPVTTHTQWPAKANAAGQWQNLQRSHPSKLDQLCKGNRLSKLSAARVALSHRGTAVVVGRFDA